MDRTDRPGQQLIMRYFLICLLLPIPSLADELDQLCIINGLEAPAHFTVEIDHVGRAYADLAPDGGLCLQGTGKGTVAVFTTREDLEGCSRRVASGTSPVSYTHLTLPTKA